MLQKFQNHINTDFAFLPKSRLLLAVSGGLDSMVLLYLCHQSGLNFAVVHCNFQLRGDESDGDEEFVKTICHELKIPIFTQKFVTAAFAEELKLSIQVVARNLRYEWFESLLQNHDYDYVLTAHHLDDSLETFLINFTRGTGLTGLTGIPNQNGNIMRPLLIFSREEIETFARENRLPWREDSSNTSDKYQRNKLRHHVVPVLKELNPSLLASFEKTIEHMKMVQSMAAYASREVYEKVLSIENEQAKFNIPELLKTGNYKAFLFQWFYSYGFTDWEAVYDLVAAQSGKQVFSETHTLLKDRESLILFANKTEDTSESYWIKKDQADVKIPLKISFCKVDDITNSTSNTIFVDEEKLQFPLEIRKWQEGDLFYPFGMTGSKKLSKYFKDEKLSLIDKAAVWLLCSDDQIVWIIGKRQSERFKITTNTTKILQINYTP